MSPSNFWIAKHPKVVLMDLGLRGLASWLVHCALVTEWWSHSPGQQCLSLPGTPCSLIWVGSKISQAELHADWTSADELDNFGWLAGWLTSASGWIKAASHGLLSQVLVWPSRKPTSLQGSLQNVMTEAFCHCLKATGVMKVLFGHHSLAIGRFIFN